MMKNFASDGRTRRERPKKLPLWHGVAKHSGAGWAACICSHNRLSSPVTCRRCSLHIS